MQRYLEQLITETENSILELMISESVKDMCLYEEDDLEPILTDIDNDNLSDIFYEKFIPYFINNSVVITEATMMQNAKQNIKYYQGLLGKKLQPTSLIGAVKSGVLKAAKTAKDSNIGKAVAGGITKAKNLVKGEAAKRLLYASKNLDLAAKRLQK